MTKLYRILILGNVFILTSCFSQNKTDKDREIFNCYLDVIKEIDNDSLFIKTACFFLNTPYDYSTLDVNEYEELVVNLQKMDCMTFVENCIALYRVASVDTPNFELFKKELQYIRYRDGIIAGYLSRLHYTTDWIFDNVKKNVFYDKSKEIGGMSFLTDVYFMSKNPQFYDYLKKRPDEIQSIKKIEDSINMRKDFYYYIPKGDIISKEKQIKTGDILCFTTSIEGLDVSHLGIAFWKDNILTFIHASSDYRKVIINTKTLSDFCMNNRNITGVIVLKANTLS